MAASAEVLATSLPFLSNTNSGAAARPLPVLLIKPGKSAAKLCVRCWINARRAALSETGFAVDLPNRDFFFRGGGGSAFVVVVVVAAAVVVEEVLPESLLRLRFRDCEGDLLMSCCVVRFARLNDWVSGETWVFLLLCALREVVARIRRLLLVHVDCKN